MSQSRRWRGQVPVPRHAAGTVAKGHTARLTAGEPGKWPDFKDRTPLNNNRGNNRRRGRGNNRQGGGGQQLNRIDSRARGNAPQLLEKYKKLAHDAHLNGDRVTEEYYLQFADHYFRVIADTRVRQEEQRQRRDDRWQEGGESYRDEGEDAGEYGSEAEYSPYDTPAPAPRREREERPRREERAAEPQPEVSAGASADGEGDAPTQDEAPQFEAPANPFLRENRGARGLKPRREPREGRDDRRPAREERPARRRREADEPAGLDPALLPPAINATREDSPVASPPAVTPEPVAVPEAAPEAAAVPAPAANTPEPEAKPRRRTRRKVTTEDDTGGAMESVG